MTTESKVAGIVTTVSGSIAVLAILVGSGIGWGVIQTRVTALEARAAIMDQTDQLKIDKEYYYQDQKDIKEDLRTIKQDVKTILLKLR